MRKESRYDKNCLGDDGIDEDGHYDETKDKRSIEDLLKNHPKELEEYQKTMKHFDDAKDD